MTNEDRSRGLIRYTSRDYNSLMEEFYNLVPQLTELWKPEADADPGVVLAKFLASACDMLGVNLDWQANELYGPSVSQRKNAEKLFGLFGYELGWYTAARTEVTFTNNSEYPIVIDFGFNGANFCTLNAYTDITNQSRVITYNVLPLTSSYGASESRSIRKTVADNVDVFATTDRVALNKGESCVRVAIEGELRYISVRVADVKANNYIIQLPSQHIDTTAIWIRGQDSNQVETFTTQWIQCDSPAEFVQPEPRFAVTYDNYSNAQIQISNYLNQLENYDSAYLKVYWIDCSGAIGCVGADVLENFQPAKAQTVTSTEDGLSISNVSNTVEFPNTYTVTGRSPETAKEAYANSRNYINTFDSLVTLPDFNRFLRREAGVDTGIVIDCQKALEYNLMIYHDKNLTDAQKSKKYITNLDFPAGDPVFDWETILELGFDPTDPYKHIFAANFKRYTAMCFAIHNNFKTSSYGKGEAAEPDTSAKSKMFTRYKPPLLFRDNIERDYAPLQAMSVELDWGYTRVFNFYIVGTITPKKPVSADVAKVIVDKVKEALALYFDPANREYGVAPTLMEIVDVIESADSRIRHFDPGSGTTPGIVWNNCDIDYLNIISFCKYSDTDTPTNNIQINSSYII